MRYITLSLALLVFICSSAFTGRKDLVITSAEFTNNGSIPVKYTCLGQQASPPLNIDNIPPETKSLALIVDDPDYQQAKTITTETKATVSKSHKKHKSAKTYVKKTVMVTCGYTNWLMWNIDTTSFIPENFRNDNEGLNSLGNTGYLGMCPPSGTHHYHFRVYALDTKLNVSKNITKTGLDSIMQGHILAKGELIGIYNKTYK